MVDEASAVPPLDEAALQRLIKSAFDRDGACLTQILDGIPVAALASGILGRYAET